MKYTQIYNDQTEGLFIVDEQGALRFSIVIAEENTTAVFNIITKILQQIDNKLENSAMMLSIEHIAKFFPSQYSKLLQLLFDFESEEGVIKLMKSLQNLGNEIDDIIPFLMSIDEQGFFEFKKRLGKVSDLFCVKLKTIETVRMFREMEVAAN